MRFLHPLFVFSIFFDNLAIDFKRERPNLDKYFFALQTGLDFLTFIIIHKMKPQSALSLLALCTLLIHSVALMAQNGNVFPQSGLVGIGTTSPAHQLHVVGNSMLDGNATLTGSMDVFGDLRVFGISASGSPTRLLGVAPDGRLVPVGMETMHIHYLVVDSAIQIGDSSFHTAYIGGTSPANHLYSTYGTMVLNGYPNTVTENTSINPLGGQVGIGFGPGTIPIGPKMSVNGTSFLSGNTGVNVLPLTDTKLAVTANSGEIGFQIYHLANTPSLNRIAQRNTVKHQNTRAFSVVYDDNNPSTQDAETFVVAGDGATKIGPDVANAYQAQLNIETPKLIGCIVKSTNPNPNNVSFLAEVPLNEMKAISVKNTANPSSPKEVFRVTGSGVAWMQEIRVRLAPFPDYVFDDNYPLMGLDSLELFVLENHHLPGMPSAHDIEESDANLGELVRLQQEKIEELTLYIIQLNHLLKVQTAAK